jgi:hypothetical protein
MHCIQGIPIPGMGVENWDKGILDTKLDNILAIAASFQMRMQERKLFQ